MSNTIIDSIVSFRNSQGEKASGTLRGVSRQSVSLEVYNPYSVAQMSEKLTSLTIRRQGRVVYEGAAVVTSLVNTGIYLVLSATLTDPWKDLHLLQDDNVSMKEEISRFLEDVEQYRNIRSGFQLAITNLRSKLSELSRWMEQVDLMSSQERQTDVLLQVKESVLPALKENFQQFEEETAKVEPQFEFLHRAFTQRDLHPLTLRSPFVHRTYSKPLGYAGDYEMVNMMLRDPHEGPNSYFKIMNSLFLLEGPAVAHKNRIDILLDRLEKEVDKAYAQGNDVKIFNLGCGPAIEIQRLLATRKMDSRIEINLLDFSEPTLAYTKQQLEKISEQNHSYPKINYVHKSVDQILRQSANIIQEEGAIYDYLYCAGLFDYFSDKACARVLKLFLALAKPGSRILATNVHKANPSLAVMEYIMEWYLVYRDEKEMEALIPDHIEREVYCDDTGVNVFLEFYRANSD